MNQAQERLAAALHEADFELEEVAAILSAINLAIVVGERADLGSSDENVRRAHRVGMVLGKYSDG